MRADIGVGIGQFLQALEFFAAGVTAEHVDGHRRETFETIAE
jgi:hypothetical protein